MPTKFSNRPLGGDNAPVNNLWSRRTNNIINISKFYFQRIFQKESIVEHFFSNLRTHFLKM